MQTFPKLRQLLGAVGESASGGRRANTGARRFKYQKMRVDYSRDKAKSFQTFLFVG